MVAIPQMSTVRWSTLPSDEIRPHHLAPLMSNYVDRHFNLMLHNLRQMNIDARQLKHAEHLYQTNLAEFHHYAKRLVCRNTQTKILGESIVKQIVKPLATYIKQDKLSYAYHQISQALFNVNWDKVGTAVKNDSLIVNDPFVIIDKLKELGVPDELINRHFVRKYDELIKWLASYSFTRDVEHQQLYCQKQGIVGLDNYPLAYLYLIAVISARINQPHWTLYECLSVSTDIVCGIGYEALQKSHASGVPFPHRSREDIIYLIEQRGIAVDDLKALIQQFI